MQKIDINLKPSFILFFMITLIALLLTGGAMFIDLTHGFFFVFFCFIWLLWGYYCYRWVLFASKDALVHISKHPNKPNWLLITSHNQRLSGQLTAQTIVTSRILLLHFIVQDMNSSYRALILSDGVWGSKFCQIISELQRWRGVLINESYRYRRGRLSQKSKSRR